TVRVGVSRTSRVPGRRARHHFSTYVPSTAAAAALLPDDDPNRAILAELTAHGLRRGPAQYLARLGQDPTGQGRWKPGSRTVERHYLAPARGRTDNPFTAARAAAEES
ncbi:hypothetical protein ACFT6X_33330, partial [Streptomyces rochei]